MKTQKEKPGNVEKYDLNLQVLSENLDDLIEEISKKLMAKELVLDRSEEEKDIANRILSHYKENIRRIN